MNYPIKHVQIATCGNLYEQWKKHKKFYRKAPDCGITVNVEYADTVCDLSFNDAGQTRTANELKHRPVVLALHGAPGSHSDFAHLIKYFTMQGVRVIAPNFPDYSMTVNTQVFRHSAEEKAEFVKDFLNAIGVNKIDMLLSHSSAIYPTLLLWDDPSAPQICSIAFFNPGGHRRIKAMKPSWFTEGSVKVYQNKLGRALFKTFGTTFLAVTGSSPVKPDNMNNVMLSATTMVYSRYHKLDERLNRLRTAKIPLLLLFSENDKLVEKEIFYEMATILGADDDCLDVFNEYGLLQKSGIDSLTKVVVFQAGGHYAFCKYQTQVSYACEQLLQKSLKSQSIGFTHL